MVKEIYNFNYQIFIMFLPYSKCYAVENYELVWGYCAFERYPRKMIVLSILPSSQLYYI